MEPAGIPSRLHFEPWNMRVLTEVNSVRDQTEETKSKSYQGVCSSLTMTSDSVICSSGELRKWVYPGWK